MMPCDSEQPSDEGLRKYCRQMGDPNDVTYDDIRKAQARMNDGDCFGHGPRHPGYVNMNANNPDGVCVDPLRELIDRISNRVDEELCQRDDEDLCQRDEDLRLECLDRALDMTLDDFNIANPSHVLAVTAAAREFYAFLQGAPA